MEDIKRQYEEASAAFCCCPNQHNHAAIARLYDLKPHRAGQPETPSIRQKTVWRDRKRFLFFRLPLVGNLCKACKRWRVGG
ncbi:hypothetical protein [Kingella oralis]|uniref:hypothetical protein n=1 Tax=Kingella oralis TaxID=505 RepID=UPI002D811529|nr:hypothetical protein [Kingella oralis]